MKKFFFLFLAIFLLPLNMTLASDGVEVENTPKTEVEGEDAVVVETIDENTKVVTNKYFDLTLERKTQNPFGNYIPYVLTVKPHLDSSKTQIIWNVPSTLSVNTKHKEFVSLKEGEVYTFKANIKPLRTGTYDFSVSVISWQHDTNYTNSIDDTITLNRNLVLQPTSTQFILLTILKWVLILGIFGAVCFLAIKVIKSYSVKAKKWLTPPN